MNCKRCTLTKDVMLASLGDDLCCWWLYRMHLEESRTLHAFEWLVKRVIIVYVTLWIFHWRKLLNDLCSNCMSCLFVLIHLVNQLMTIILIITMRWDWYMCVCVCVYIYIWCGDSFDNDDCLLITLNWWIVLVELSMLNEE